MVRIRREFVFLLVLLLSALTGLPAATARADVSPEEAKLLERIDAPRALRELARLSREVVRAGSGLGPGTIVSGSPAERLMAADIARSMKAIGLSVHTETFPVRAYRYGPVTLTVGGEAVPAISLHAGGAVWGLRDGVPYARGQEAGGHQLRAPLVQAGDGYASDYAHAGDVRGKVVLVKRDLRDWPPAQITEAAVRGAVAILFYGHPDSASQPDALRQDSMWGHEQIPALAVSQRSAESLQRRLAAGAVEVVLDNSADIGDGTSRNVIGMLPGSDLADEWVVVSAHYDRWFWGAADNTSGTAAVLELARAFAASGLKPRRSMLFVAAGSEEAGQEDPERDWLAGSLALLARHPEIARNAALVFNIDLLGWYAPKAILHATPDILGSERAVLRDLDAGEGFESATGAGAVTDAWNYGVVGGAATSHVERFNSDYFPIYHTQLDTYRPELFSNMRTDLRVLALSLWRAASRARLPIELSAIADLVDGAVTQDGHRVPDVSMDAVRAALAEFRDATRAIEVAEGLGDPANRVLMAVRHGLVPWLYATDDDFAQVVRTTAYANRVVVYDRVIAALGQDDPSAAGRELAAMYEGRQCQRLSPPAFELERGFWAGDGGWASRYGQRVPPPPPPFETLCRGLAAPQTDVAALKAGFVALRAGSVADVSQSTALMAAKLRQATLTLREFRRGRGQ